MFHIYLSKSLHHSFYIQLNLSCQNEIVSMAFRRPYDVRIPSRRGLFKNDWISPSVRRINASVSKGNVGASQISTAIVDVFAILGVVYVMSASKILTSGRAADLSTSSPLTNNLMYGQHLEENMYLHTYPSGSSPYVYAYCR